MTNAPKSHDQFPVVMPEARLFGLARSLRMPAYLEQAPIQSMGPPVAKVCTCIWEQAAACLDEMGQRERFDRASLQSTETPSFPSPVTTRSRPLIPNRPRCATPLSQVPSRPNGWPDCLKTRSLPPGPLSATAGGRALVLDTAPQRGQPFGNCRPHCRMGRAPRLCAGRFLSQAWT
jgi:hypothetical protein